MEPNTASDEPLVQNCPACGAAMDVSDVEPLSAVTCPECGAPTVITATIDHFELVDVIGHGGMGAVYKAHDTSLDRPVALKLLKKSSGSPEQIAQLETEAAITASINHPHVVRVFSTGMDHGRFYIAMELVEKGTLDGLIELQGRVAEAQVLEVGIQIASGLRAAQHAGLIHRDVKPGNILFADSHTAKIVDFGLAIFAEDEAKTRGEIWGTPYYVAPEKLDHKPEDFRSDIYSLGGTLFHALAGRPPFEAENASLVALKHLKNQAVSLQAFAPHVSGNTAYVINRTLAKDPEQRYQSYDELIEHFEYARTELLTNEGKPQQVKRVVMETDKDKQVMGWFVLGLIGLLVALGVGAFVFRDRLFASGENNGSGAGETGNMAGFAPAFDRLSEGKPGDAGELLSIMAQKATQPQLSWADLFLGLAQTMDGRRAQAAGSFEKIVSRGPYSKKEADKPLADFLVDVAKKMQGGNAIDPASVNVTSNANYEPVAFLLYGVKDWDLGSFDNAAVLLRRFRQAMPSGKDAWLVNLKPVATAYIEQFTAFEMVSDRAKNAKTPEEKKAALAALKAVQGKLAPRAQELATKLGVDQAKQDKEHTAAMWAQGKVPDGRYKLINRQNGKVLEVEGHSKADGHKVQQFSYAGQPNQQWNVSVQGNGLYLVVGAESGKALTVPAGKTDDLVGLVQGTVNKAPAPAQRWKIEKADGAFWKFTSEVSGKALTAIEAAQPGGDTIVQKAYTGAPEQQWKFEAP